MNKDQCQEILSILIDKSLTDEDKIHTIQEIGYDLEDILEVALSIKE